MGDLRKLAEAATPGPWTYVSRGTYWHEEEADVRGPDGDDIEDAEFVKPIGDVFTTRGQMYRKDAAYIAACSPERILALLDALAFAAKHCPCGARHDSLNTHPHVTGCPIAAALDAGGA